MVRSLFCLLLKGAERASLTAIPSVDVQGVAETIARYFELQGMSQEEAKSKFWLVDSRVRCRTVSTHLC